MSIRPIKRLSQASSTIEGAGVHLRRAFGFGDTSDFDPFLLLDDFRNDVPEDYLKGLCPRSTVQNRKEKGAQQARALTDQGAGSSVQEL